MADAPTALPTDRPTSRRRRTHDPQYWERRCQRLELAVRHALLTAPLSPGQRAALFGKDYELTDVEKQLIRAYRALTGEDRLVIRRLLSTWSPVDVARRDKRDKLAARRRKTMKPATTKGGA